jgi:hypothetical protein
MQKEKRMMTKVLAPLDGSPQSAVALWVSLLALDAQGWDHPHDGANPTSEGARSSGGRGRSD